jgi:glycosyltransferase involved in cell wall biosynthesis
VAAAPLLIADGDIPTTQHFARVLQAVYGAVEVRSAENLFGASVDGRRVFISRLCQPSHAWLPEYLARRQVVYFYLLDDNFWELTPAVDPHLARFFQHPAALQTLEIFVRGARGVLVWSSILGGEIARRVPGSEVHFVPPHFDAELVRDAMPSEPVPPDRPLRIGYPSTPRPSVEDLLVALVRHVARKYRGSVEFEFFGWIPAALGAEPGVRFIAPVARYEDFLRMKLARQWQVGIAPLIGSPFDRCKTSLKYREYGGCRIAGIYSDVEPFRCDVSNGVTGMLVENRLDAWVAAIESLVDDPSKIAAIAEAAARDVAERFSLAASLRALSALDGGVRT